jgi:P27 family predicted phage terminase small subunit
MKKDTRKKSNRIKFLSGNAGKRKIKSEPQYSKVDSDAPEDLDEIGKAEWIRVVPQLREAGVLTKMDEAILFAYCDEFSIVKQCTKKIQEQGLMIRRTPRSKTLTPNPYLSIKQKSTTLLKSLAVELGLTPVSRGRVSVNSIPKDDPYKALRERRAKSLADAQAKFKKKTKPKKP